MKGSVGYFMTALPLHLKSLPDGGKTWQKVLKVIEARILGMSDNPKPIQRDGNDLQGLENVVPDPDGEAEVQPQTGLGYRAQEELDPLEGQVYPGGKKTRICLP